MVDRSDKKIQEPAMNIERNTIHEQGSQIQPSVSISGPRITEQSSGDESSSQSAESLAGSGDNIAGLAGSAAAAAAFSRLTPQSHIADYDKSVGPADSIAGGMASTSLPNVGNDVPQTTPFLNPSDQMELDQNFFQFLGDMDNFPEGDMTGFDDWTSLSTDMLGLPNDFNVPVATTPDGTTTL